MRNIRLISVLFLILGGVLLLRLGYLQLFCYEELSQKAMSRELLTVTLEQTRRGAIIDRNGLSITADGESADLLIVPSLLSDAEKDAALLGKALKLSPRLLLGKIQAEKSDGSVYYKEPFIAQTDLTAAEIEKVEALACNGAFVVLRQGRYDRQQPCQHLLGVLGEATAADIESGVYPDGTKAGDTVGLSGLERIYNSVLDVGGERKISFAVDAKNAAVQREQYYLHRAGDEAAGRIELTVDVNIQRAVEAAFGDKEGAAVIMDSTNGDILAIASSPRYDYNQTTENRSDDVYVNKALASYPPASLFKTFIAAVALENHVVEEETHFFCSGGYTLRSGEIVHCWEREGHGDIAFTDALAESCNSAFISTSRLLGAERLKKAFHLWQLDQDILVGYPLKEVSSLTLTKGGEGELSNIALGESGVLLSPLNLTKMVNVIAAGGLLYTPRVVTAAINSDGTTAKRFDTALPVRVISKSVAEEVTVMMKKTMTQGTAAGLNLTAFDIAAKTGSSETGNVWLGGFLPSSKPKYTFVVLVSDGESGTADCGPILKKICGFLGDYDASLY